MTDNKNEGRDAGDHPELSTIPLGNVIIPEYSEERQFNPSLIITKRLGTISGPLLAKHTNELFEESDLPRGVLSETDREFLLGQKEYAHKQSRSNRKRTIRERVKHSIYDFRLLWMYLPPLERDRIFETMEDADMETSIESLITFAYLSVGQAVTEMERRIENGIIAGAAFDPESKEDGEVTNVDVSIDIDYKPRVAELMPKLEEQPDELKPAEIGVLVRMGEIDQEDLTTLQEINFISGSPSGEVEEAEGGNSGKQS